MRRKRVSKYFQYAFVPMIIILALIYLGTTLSNSQTITNKHTSEKIYEPTNYIIGKSGSAHHHSTLLIFIKGELRRFDYEKYYGASPYVHIHDYSFAEIHTHATNVTLGLFLQTIEIKFNSTCLVFIEQEYYCNNQTHNLKFYVEGNPNAEFGNHLTADWEHYLITYGDDSEEEIRDQIGSVPDPTASPGPGQQPSIVRIADEYL